MQTLDTIEAVRERLIEISKPLLFDEPTHQYTWVTGKRKKKLISATTLIGKFKPDIFTPEFVKKLGEKRKVDPIYLQRSWDHARDFSCMKGNIVHTYAEHYFRFNRKRLDFNDEVTNFMLPYFNAFDSFAKNQVPEKIFSTWVGTEIRIAVPEKGVAGTIDCLFADVQNHRMLLLDWKTNKTLKKAGEGNRLLPPLEKYTDSEIDVYSLQLSLYSSMLAHHFPGWTFERRLVHLMPEGYNKIKIDMVDDVVEILEAA